MFDTITRIGEWAVFTALPFLAGAGLLLSPVGLIWAVIYWRRMAAWKRCMHRDYPQILALAGSWSMDGPPELTSALCHVVWLLYWQDVCARNRVPRLRWEARRGESWAEYAGRMLVRFTVLRALLPPESRLRAEPLKALTNEVHMAFVLGVEHCGRFQEYVAEKEIRRAAWKSSQDLRRADEHHGALFWIATSEHWDQKIDALRDRLPVDSPARTKSIEELAREYVSDPRWQKEE